MKGSSNRLTLGVVAVCLLVIVACFIAGRLKEKKLEKEERREGASAVARAPREASSSQAERNVRPVIPEKKPELPESPKEVEEFDISGIVIDKSGKPMEGAKVKVNFYSLKNFSMESGTGVEQGKSSEYTTKEDGRFGFKYLEGMRYVLQAEKEDYVPVMKNMGVPQKDIVITLTLGGAIEGKVIDAVTLQPMDSFRIVTSEDTGGGLSLGFFSKKEQDIYLPTVGKEFNNPDGTFRLTGLQEGKYRLTSLAEGYAQSSKGGIEVKLEKTTAGVVIEQQPAGKIRGRVIDAMGKPIQEATIIQKNPFHSLLLGELRLPQMTILATSDPKGEFEISGLPAGKFTLQARHQDYCPAEQEVKVNKGESTDGVVFQLVQGARISGVVVAKVDLQPVAEAAVKAATGSSFLIPSAGAAECKTDHTGAFDLIKLEPGMYSLVASAENFAEKTIENLKLAENQVISNLIIELSQGGSLVGTVRDHTGKPMPNMMIFAVGPGGQKVTQTDKEGNYAIRNLKEGTYVAGAAEASGGVGMTAGRSDSHFVRIENDRETRLDITVGGALKIYGKVTRKGEPQPGLIVTIGSSNNSTMATKSSRSASDTTEEDGRYEIEGVQPGQYDLAVMKVVGMMPTGLFEAEIEMTDADLEKNIELPAGEISGRVMDAENREPIEGAKVTLERSRSKDIQEAVLSKLGLYVGGSESTNSEGKYSFAIVEDGAHFLIASKEGYAPQALTAEVQNSQGPSNLDFSLSKGVILSGRVTGGDPSRPVKEIFLSARDSAGRTVYSKRITLSESGEYEATGLPPGEYLASVDARGYASAIKKVTIGARADNRADFALTSGGTLVIKALDERGKAVPGAHTALLDEQGNFWLGFFPDLKELMNIGFEAITREDGLDISKNIPEGKYRVKISAAGYDDEFVNVAVREGEQTDQTVTLRKAR